MKKMVFSASKAAIEKVTKQRRTEWFQIGLWLFWIMVALCVRMSDDMVWEWAKDWHTSRSTMETWLTIAIIIGLFFLVLAIAFYCKFNADLRRLEQSFLSIEDNKITGAAYTEGADALYNFSCQLSEVTHACAVGGGSGNNLIISTRDATYSCYQIENAPTAAQYINEILEKMKGGKSIDHILAAYNAHHEQKQEPEEKQDSPTCVMPDIEYNGLHCPICGENGMSLDQKECVKCGIAFVFDEYRVVPLKDGNWIKCPICGEKGMPENCKACWNCGAEFVCPE